MTHKLSSIILQHENHLLPPPYETNCTDYLENWKARKGEAPLNQFVSKYKHEVKPISFNKGNKFIKVIKVWEFFTNKDKLQCNSPMKIKNCCYCQMKKYIIILPQPISVCLHS